MLQWSISRKYSNRFNTGSLNPVRATYYPQRINAVIEIYK